MNCDEFREYWNRRLDLQQAGLEAIDAEERERASGHAGGCAECARLHVGFRYLERAIATLPPVPAHQRALTARTLERYEREKVGVLRGRFPEHFPGRFARYAAAALILAGSFAYWVRPRDRRGDGSSPVASRTTEVPKRPLEDVLADAASATMALARETSAPAARLGRDVIDSASLVTLPDLGAADPTPTPAKVASSSMLERIGQGVRPLGEPARNAFSFLVPRVPDDRVVAPTNDPAKGT